MAQFDPVAVADAEAGGGPLPHPVEGEDRGFLEGRREESRSGVRLVVLGEDDPAPVLTVELAANLSRQVELLPHPQRHRLEKGPEARRSKGEVGFEDALELEEGLVVEADVIQVPGLQACFMQTVGDGIGREGVVVLDAREAFFLRGGHDFAINNQRRSRVVVVGGDSEDRGWFLARPFFKVYH